MLSRGLGAMCSRSPPVLGGSFAFLLEISRSHRATEEQTTSVVQKELEFARSSEARGLRGLGLGCTIDAWIEGRLSLLLRPWLRFRPIYPLQVVVRPQCAVHAGSGSPVPLMPGARGGHQPLEDGKLQAWVYFLELCTLWGWKKERNRIMP